MFLCLYVPSGADETHCGVDYSDLDGIATVLEEADPCIDDVSDDDTRSIESVALDAILEEELFMDDPPPVDACGVEAPKSEVADLAPPPDVTFIAQAPDVIRRGNALDIIIEVVGSGFL